MAVREAPHTGRLRKRAGAADEVDVRLARGATIGCMRFLGKEREDAVSLPWRKPKGRG